MIEFQYFYPDDIKDNWVLLLKVVKKGGCVRIGKASKHLDIKIAGNGDFIAVANHNDKTRTILTSEIALKSHINSFVDQ